MKISKLEPSKRKKGRFLLHMEDGNLLRVGEHEVVSFSLYSGMELDEETQAELLASAQKSSWKATGVNLVATKPMSRKEVIEKLVKKEASQEEGEEVADYLENLGLINDQEYAKIVVRHYSGKGYGQYKLTDELYRRGVPKSMWDEALEFAETSDDAIDQFVQRKLKGNRPDQKELKRLSDALARRGYKWQEISAALSRYDDQLNDDLGELT